MGARVTLGPLPFLWMTRDLVTPLLEKSSEGPSEC